MTKKIVDKVVDNFLYLSEDLSEHGNAIDYNIVYWNSARLRLRAEDTIFRQEYIIGRACLHPLRFLYSARYIVSIQ